jgi:hypothetical protein
MIVSLRSIRPFPASVDAGAQATANMAVTPNYSGSVNVTCDTSAMPGAQCVLPPRKSSGDQRECGGEP